MGKGECRILIGWRILTHNGGFTLAISLALIILLGLLSDHFLRKLRVPGLVGMLFVGMALGPHAIDVMHPALLAISQDVRMMALVVILLRAGLKIRRDMLKQVGSTVLAMSDLPSTLEGVAVMFAAPVLLGLGMLESAILGFVLAAVSPAVVVPSMIQAMEKKRGTDKGIPTMILAASSLDNAYVIVVFSTVLGMFTGDMTAVGNPLVKLFEVPVSIVFGAAGGAGVGLGINALFNRYNPRATKKALIVLGAGVVLGWVETVLRGTVPVSGLIAVMTVGFVILEKNEEAAHAISNKLAKVWVLAEILLFVLVGAQVDVSVALDSGAAGLGLICVGLAARSVGTWISTLGMRLTPGERVFCLIAYIPKATVQAAVGALPLAAGVPGGATILAVAVLSIIVTAPLGVMGIDWAGKRFLSKG
jgi:NhaP-type Na+/H+ or K+/H+ antiporter